jgi:hypothetical protein
MIDQLLLAKTPLRTVAAQCGVNKSTLSNHRARCMGLGPVPTKQMREEAAAPSRLAAVLHQLPSADDLGGILNACIARLDTIVTRCETSGADAIAISGIDGIRKQVGDLARLAGHVGTGSQNVNVAVAVSITADQVVAGLAQHLQSADGAQTILALESIDD